MQDRPTSDELLAAVERFLDTEIVPNVPGSRGFHARVAANAIRTVRRELELEDDHLRAEWTGLDAILGEAALPSTLTGIRAALRTRNEELCDLIRTSNTTEEISHAVRDHIRRIVESKLRVTNPGLLARPAAALDHEGLTP
jgi:hypothetical protein